MPTAPPSLLDISITELGALLSNGAINSHVLVELFSQRVREVNDELKAVIEINPDAFRIANDLDAERANGTVRGPLHGIPIVVKDNYATRDGMLTGSGSVCLAQARPSEDATAVAKLRDAGAIILAKANLDEFSGGRAVQRNGWSSRGGQTFGAYVKYQTACGSSSGSGVAASLGLAAGTLGTETAGSITCPAMYNNVVGIKPTVGLTSRFGTVPVSFVQDTVGPIAQSVENAAIILDAIAGKDPNDNYTSAQPWDTPPSFTAALDPSALRGARIGVVWLNEDFINASNFQNIDYIRPVFDRALADLETAGAELVNVELEIGGLNKEDFVRWVKGNNSIHITAEFKESLTRYVEEFTEPDRTAMRNVSELLECLRTDSRELADKYNLGPFEEVFHYNKTVGSYEVWEAYITASTMTHNMILGPLREHQLDALVMLPEIALAIGAVPGLPIVTVPMGVIGPDAKLIWDKEHIEIVTGPSIPLGLSFIADRWSDRDLIGYGYAYEQMSKRRRELDPVVKPVSDLDLVLKRYSLGDEL
ncbi:amidase signature enzyme [Xylariaceae sp. FL0255]|nr:amidase signature enzyme [Xylariaceae sp. FL0255]